MHIDNLSPAERQVMQIGWDRGEVSASELEAHSPRRRRATPSARSWGLWRKRAG